MSVRTTGLPDDVYQYIRRVSDRETPVLARLRAATAPRPEAEMQISPEQGQFMALLAKLIGARRCIEIGTYTGYSALAVAMALPADGKLIACDVSDEFTRIGRPFWKAAGVESKIDLRLQPALKTLDELLNDGQQNTFDFAFVDAIKEEYPAYYERLLGLLRQGGLMVFDNMLGTQRVRVGDTSRDDPHLASIVAFNQQLTHDTRVSLSLLPLWMGVTLALKR
jgi:caffeoyl-CoA O-methyltransferase